MDLFEFSFIFEFMLENTVATDFYLKVFVLSYCKFLIYWVGVNTKFTI